MKKRLLSIFAVLMVIMLVLGGCGSAYSGADGGGIAAPGKPDNAYEIVEDTSTGTGSTPRKVIVRAELSLKSTDFSHSTQVLEQSTLSCGGYIEEAMTSGGSEDSYARYTLRIPTNKYNDFVTAIAAAGEVSDRSYSEEDISDQYYDLDARRKAKASQRDRLLELMAQADNLSDLLVLEDKLTQVQGELDSLTGTQQRYDNQVAYATVTVTVWQSTLTISGATPFGSRVAQAFRDSFATAGEVIKELVIALIWLLPLLLLVAVAVVIILLATRRRRHARKQAKPAPTYTPPMWPPVPPVQTPPAQQNEKDPE